MAVRMGADAPLGGSFSWYPHIALGLGGASYDERSGAGENKADETRSWVALGAPVLAHVAPHFFLGLGPTLSHDLGRSDQYQRSNHSTTVGASALVGGWL